MKQVKVFLADGFEEIEGLTVVDILRRAGVCVETVSIMKDKEINGAHGIKVQADVMFADADFSECDMLVLPGGMPGTLHLKEHAGLAKLLVKFHEEKKYVAAICAAPSVLGGLGILRGKKACCYPSFEEALDTEYVVFDPVAEDGHVITSRGMGTAIPFALKLTEVLCGEEKAQEISKSIIFA
ncbi:MAG: DJ-1/PfpI family protein [Ruminococcus sp.]|nr:DJ-1/PfpI family protein [Ruminococcus sp.]